MYIVNKYRYAFWHKTMQFFNKYYMIKCKICNKEFNNEHALNVHIGQYEHLTRLEYLVKYEQIDMTCPICKINLRHMDSHSRIQKTCKDPKCRRTMADITGIKNNGISNSQAGANAMKQKWENASISERKQWVEKISNTLYERYGVEHALQKDEFLNKAKLTNIERYGYTSYSKTPEFKNNLHNFWANDENVQKMQNNLQKTLLEKYGYTNASQIPEVKKKKLEKFLNKTMEQKYFSILKAQETQRKNNNGLLWCQTHQAHSIHRSELIFNNIIFDSQDELSVYKFCLTNNIPCIYQPESEILLYTGVDNKIHAYHPDFKINGRLVEVKGSHFFNNEGILYCPFARNKPDISIRDGNAKIKYQLMLEHKVIILVNGDLTKLKEIL